MPVSYTHLDVYKRQEEEYAHRKEHKKTQETGMPDILLQDAANLPQDLFLFDDLCISGGIVNAYQAILEAEKMNSQKK